MVNDMKSAPKPVLPDQVEENETHFERLARLVQGQDRRAVPFDYAPDPPRSERRRWDLAANLSARR